MGIAGKGGMNAMMSTKQLGSPIAQAQQQQQPQMPFAAAYNMAQSWFFVISHGLLIPARDDFFSLSLGIFGGSKTNLWEASYRTKVMFEKFLSAKYLEIF